VGEFGQASDVALTAERERLAVMLAGVGVFTPGSFQESWTKCGKPGCHCMRPDDPGHGPFYSVARYEGGRMVTRRVPADLAEVFRSRVGAWGEFQDVCARLADVNAEESRRLLLARRESSRRPTTSGQKGG